MRLALICGWFLSLGCGHAEVTHEQPRLGAVEFVPTGSQLPRAEQAARDAAVEVITPDGTGSGTYVSYKGYHLILTASHVVFGSDVHLVAERLGPEVEGRVVYDDSDLDIAFLMLPSEMQTRDPIKLSIRKEGHGVGTRIGYTGFPNDTDLVSLEGRIAGIVPDSGYPYYLIQSYSWFGASGSGVFDDKGYLVGVVSSLEIGAPIGVPLENMVLVAPSTGIDFGRLDRGIAHEQRRQVLALLQEKWEIEQRELFPERAVCDLVK